MANKIAEETPVPVNKVIRTIPPDRLNILQVSTGMGALIKEISQILTSNDPNGKPIILEELNTGCIVCISHKVGDQGYLLLRRSGKLVRAHRLLYTNFHGSIQQGFFICHHCDNRDCLNPHHFFAGTHEDNMRDMARKDRAFKAFGNTWGRGEKSGSAKLTTRQIYKIRKKHRTGKYTCKELGYEYGVCASQINRIVKRLRWRHLGDTK